MSRTLLLVALFLGLGARVPRITPEERVRILDRFDHREHGDALDDAGLSCPACHQVGGAAGGTLAPEARDEAFLSPPPTACHACHVPADGKRGHAPGACGTCHATDIRPADHHDRWAAEHGSEARLQGRACETCHGRSECVDCHERRDTTRYRVHDRNWLSVHGIAVQADPAACGTCHLRSECTSCHATGRGKRP